MGKNAPDKQVNAKLPNVRPSNAGDLKFANGKLESGRHESRSIANTRHVNAKHVNVRNHCAKPSRETAWFPRLEVTKPMIEKAYERPTGLIAHRPAVRWSRTAIPD